MVLDTAKKYFDENVVRADALFATAQAMQAGPVKGDLFRAAWMMVAGAADAYFCDAYGDLLSRVLRAKDLQASMRVSEKIRRTELPVSMLLGTNTGWKWRLAARRTIEKKSVLSLSDIKTNLRVFCRSTNNLLAEGTFESWITHANSTKRMLGITRQNYMASANQKDERAKALKAIERRVDSIFQRRHDCIHCCDRPRTAIQTISEDETLKAKLDIIFLVERCHDHLTAEFPLYLADLGASGITRNRVGA